MALYFPDLLTAYHNRKHRTTVMKPINITSANQAQVLERFSTTGDGPVKKPKFKINDKVRVSKVKQAFEKGYTPNWSTEIFTIARVAKTNPITYHLKDYENQPVYGGFDEQKLLQAKCPDVYLVEKVIKKPGDKIYVKWLGFDSSHNSWINKSDL